MHIIFGDEQANKLKEKYTVLELDTFQIGKNGPVIKAFCTVETVPFKELTTLESATNQHQHLLLNFKMQNWHDCLQGITELKGKWGGELDTFYNDLESRINAYLANPPPADWTPVIQK